MSNSYTIMALSRRLHAHVYSMNTNYSTSDFSHICISLARSIDDAIANSEVPSFDREFPRLLKQVCKRRNEDLLQAAIMVLMISVKNACENGWFSHTDSEELKTLAYEIGSAFCSPRDINTETNSLEPTISTIMSRFYPQMKIDQILGSLTAKPGYEAYVMDFQLPKKVNSSLDDIWLFVAQIDNLETSACIISPQQVNFLLNGKGVERRTNIFMDDGPQLPTNLAKLLKYGTNLLQAVGQFNGNYAIIVAYMSMGTTPVRPSLQDYVQPTVAILDSELIEGPSRVSLKCPISMKRVKTPAKGHSCNHHQCFDLDNYVDINSRRPSWRCPHCNQSVCFNDIRVDQKMVKILEEVGVNVANVMISAYGSWKAATESNDQSDKQHDKTSNCIPDVLPQQEPSCTANDLPDIMDLTEGDDEMNTVGACDNECMKPLLAYNQDQLNKICTTNTSVVNQNTPLHIEDYYWSGVYLPIHGPETSDGRIDAQGNGVSVSAPTSCMISSVLTDAVSPAINREPESCHAPSLTTSLAPSRIAAPVNTLLQQSGSSDMINEYGKFPSAPINTNRVPVAVQTLPAQASTTVSQQRPRNTSQTSPNQLMVNGSGPVLSNVERHQQSRSQVGSHQGSHMSSSSLQQHVGSRGSQGQLFSPSRASQPITNPPASSQHTGGYEVPTVLIPDGQNLHQQPIGKRMSHIRSQSPSLARSSAHLPPTQTHQGGMLNRVTSTPLLGQQQQQFRSSAQRAFHTARMQSQSHSILVQAPPISKNVHAHSRPLMGNTGGTVQLVTRPESFVDSSAGQDWRPTGRMRGSLSGPAYSAALNQYIIQPTQTVRRTSPLSNRFPSALDVLMAMNTNVTKEANPPATQPASTAG